RAETCVVDVGGEWEPGRMNFDHHQFPRDAEPLCALSLVLKHLDLYADASQFCEWLEVAEWIDTRGIVETSQWLGVEREIMARLNSPIDISLLRRFSAASDLRVGDPLWEIMKMVGEDLLDYLRTLRERLAFIAENAEFWSLEDGREILFMPRTEPLAADSSMGLGRYIEQCEKEESVIGMIYPDRRGSGYGLSRYQDYQGLEFTRIESEADVHFAHARGFVAKTSATDPERLLALIKQSRHEG
ncbi:MAG: MYG1 family protein, partial [Verrucomicrobiales bacterium]